VTSAVSAQGFNSITSPDGTNVIAVGNSGKIYRSANGGVTYTNTILAGSPNLYSVTSLGEDIWIAGQDGNVRKTSVSASSFNIYNTGTSVNLYSIYFIDANTGYVCGDAGNVYKTVNGGVNWTLSDNGISGGKLNSISFAGANHGSIAADNGIIHVTTDGGDSWTTEASGTTNNLLKVKYFGSERYVTGEFGTLLQSSGSGWNDIKTRTNSDIRGLTGTSANDVHVCGGGGFIRNNKSGSSNFFNFEINPMLADLTDIFYLNIMEGWAVSSLNSVIIYTTNGGTTWNMPTGAAVSYNWVSKPGASGSFLGNNLCQNPNDRNSFFIAFSNRVYVSRNRGESWALIGTAYPGSSTPHSFFVSPLDTNIWLVATQASGGDIVARTTDYGATWTTVLTKNFSNYGQPLEIDQNNPSVFYFAPDGGGFWKSTNSGASFDEISGNYPFRSPCEVLVTWDSSEVILIGDGVTSSGRAKMFKSTNGGVNWTVIDSVTSSETPSMCNSVFDNKLVWCTEWSGSNIYKSTNMGSSFSVHRSTGFQGWGSDVCREDPTVVMTGGWSAITTLSTNGGTNWTNISSGLSGHGGGILIAERGLILAQQGSNIYKLNIVYTDNPVTPTIDVQSLSLGGTGIQYYTSSTIYPTGMVKNNNGAASATFNVTRRISPGNYLSTKTVTSLPSNSSAPVTFDQWTFSAGTTYTVTDSVYIPDDANTSNDVLSGTLTPYLGEQYSIIKQEFIGSFPPANWSFIFTGTNYWVSSSVSGYQIGTGAARYNFWDSPSGTIQSLVTNEFTPTIEGDSLKFDHAYRSLTNSSVDSIIIETSTDGGETFSVLVRLRGRNTDTVGVGNSIKTVASATGQFTPTLASQWRTKSYLLPVGTNIIKFRARSGFGNNFFMDNVIVNSINMYTQFNVKLVPEGLFNGVSKNISDTVRAYLRSTVSPFGYVDSSIAVINQATLNAPFTFKYAPTGSYYIQIIHRNALETWSKAGGESLTKGFTSNFDFTSGQSQAYGNNMILVGSKWCLYSGDLNRDGIIELTDLLEVYNNASSFASGYVTADLTGDGIVDLLDILIIFNNANSFVSVKSPELSMSEISDRINDAKAKMNDYNIKSYETGKKNEPVSR
jgi:photosystem II stability/assembly factor-like uncharacterized protein